MSDTNHKENETQQDYSLYDTLACVYEAARWMLLYQEDGSMKDTFLGEVFQKLLGYSEDEAVHPTKEQWIEHIVPEDRARVLACAGQIENRDCIDDTFEAEFRMRRKDGTIHWYHATARRFLDDNGNPHKAVGFFMDITRQKVLELQSRIFNVLSLDYHVVSFIDAEHHTIRILRSQDDQTIMKMVRGEMNSQSYEDTVNQYIDTYILPEDRERVRNQTSIAYLLDNVDGEKLTQINFMEWDAEKKVHYQQGSYLRVMDEAGNLGFVAGFRRIDDIIQAEQKKQAELEERQQMLEEAYEEQEAQLEEIRVLNEELDTARIASDVASEAKTSFLFNMSHDIRSPMNAIVGFTNLLAKNLDNKEQAEDYIKKIQAANEFLLSLVNNVLEMARIESGKATVDESYGQVSEIVRSICAVFDATIREKMIDFKVHTTVEHDILLIDVTKVREIMLNVISNAVKYTAEGGRIAVDVQEIPSDTSGVALIQTTVSDSGIGMPEEFLPHLYDAFTREKNTTESGIMGTGLGMMIVKKLVDLLGGNIAVDSELGRGTTFVITIPHRIADYLPRQEGTPETERRNDVSFKGMRILLAEDNELNAEIAMTLLAERGFLLDHAADGVICVDMMEKAAPGYYDLILMDVQMPQMDGYKATRTIRKMDNPIRASIPIIAMTANAFAEDRQRALLAGMDAHVSKPFDMNGLCNTIWEVLQRKRIQS